MTGADGLHYKTMLCICMMLTSTARHIGLLGYDAVQRIASTFCVARDHFLQGRARPLHCEEMERHAECAGGGGAACSALPTITQGPSETKNVTCVKTRMRMALVRDMRSMPV
jgi:hypothetical protein